MNWHPSLRCCLCAPLQPQAYTRGMLARKAARAARMEAAAVKIQTAFRRHVMRRQYAAVVGHVTVLQALWRGCAARAQYAEARRHRSALAIQSGWRGAVAREHFNALRGAAVLLQGAIRCKRAAAELRNLKSEAREAGKLLEDKKALEGKVGWSRLHLACVGVVDVGWGDVGSGPDMARLCWCYSMHLPRWLGGSRWPGSTIKELL